MERLTALSAEWVFAGHGMWHQIGSAEWTRQMGMLAPAMRSIGRQAWAQRPYTTYNWY